MNRNAISPEAAGTSSLPILLIAGLIIWAIMGLGDWFQQTMVRLVVAQMELLPRLPYSGF